MPRPLHKIGLEDVQALVGRVRESKTLELKASLPPGKDGAMKMLAGVSALANTSGGDFIIGVSEADGVASSVDGIQPDGGVDTYKRTLQQLLADRLEPRLPTVDLQEVECAPGRWVFIIRVARSWIGPHRVTSNNHFYLRTSASTVPMDVEDLRLAFSQRDIGVDRIEAFRRDRLLQLSAGRTPIPLAAGPIMVLHMAPLPAFINRDVLDIVTTVSTGAHMPVPLGGRGRDAFANILGVCNALDGGNTGASGYGQLFRSGAYEGTHITGLIAGEPYIAGVRLANMGFKSKKIESGFFNLPNALNVSDVLFINAGTMSKFTRMGVVAGFGDDAVRYILAGLMVDPDPNATVGRPFAFDVADPSYEEGWATSFRSSTIRALRAHLTPRFCRTPPLGGRPDCHLFPRPIGSDVDHPQLEGLRQSSGRSAGACQAHGQLGALDV